MAKKLKYRIVTDNYNGYEAQWRPWWSPIWFVMDDMGTGTNTFKTVEEAKAFIEKKRKKESSQEK